MSLTTEERKAIIDYRLEKADMTFNDVVKSVEYGMYSTAANRLYYAFYYAAGALLISKGISAHTHSGVQAMMHMHFVKPSILTTDDGALIRKLFTLRQESDYDDFVIVTYEDIAPLLPNFCD